MGTRRSGVPILETPVAFMSPPQAPTQAPVSNTSVGNLEAALAEAVNLPQVTYEERLKKHGITMEEALHIVSSIFDKNYYEKEYKLTKERSVVFKTRTTSDQERVLQEIESRNLQYSASIAQLVSTYNLAVSLVKIKQVDLTNSTFAEKLKIVQGFSGALLYVLSKKLNQFDNMVTDVIDDGAVENF
jgi:hypothetical protein